MSEYDYPMTVDHFIVMLANKIMILNTDLDYDDLLILKKFLDRRLSLLQDLILHMILCGKLSYMIQYLKIGIIT